MRVLLAGGGTAGHINPALAIAGFIKQKKPDTEFLFVGNKGGMEETLVPQAGYNMKFIVISGFNRKLSPKGLVDNVKTVKRTITSSIDAKKIIKEFKPDICIGTGGFRPGYQSCRKARCKNRYSRAECLSGNYKQNARKRS